MPMSFPATMSLRFDGSQLAAAFSESLFYGIYIVLLVQCIEALLYRAKTRCESLVRPVPITAAILFTTITAHWILDLLLAFEAFIRPLGEDHCTTCTSHNPAELVYLNYTDPKYVSLAALYVLSTLIGDGFMIYRLYIIWSRNVLIIIPSTILCLGLAVTGGMVTYLISQATAPMIQTAGTWVTSCFVLTFLNNLFSTSLIAYRIYVSNQELGRVNLDAGSVMQKVMEVFVQSAALYSVFVIIAMGAYLGHSNIQFPIVSATGPVIGIIFCMIVTRAHRFTNGAMKQASLSLRWRTQTEILRPMALHLETRAEGVLSAELRTPPTWPRVDLNTSSEKDIPNGVEVV